MRPSEATVLSRPSTVWRSRMTSRWRSRCEQERVLGLLEELLQRVGVGGVAGLGALGLGHVELVEEHHLQLLGRAEVDLLADDVVGVVGGAPHLVAELRLQALEVVGVDRDAHLLHPRARVPISGSSTSASSRVPPCSSTASSSASARSRTARACSIAVSRAGVVHRVEAELVGVAGVLPQLALEVAQGQVGEVVGALVGLDQVGRQSGVDVEPGEVPATRGQREHGALGVVDRLGRAPGRPATPRAPRRPRGELGHVEPGGRAVAGGQGEESTSPVPARQLPWTATPTPLPRRRVLVEPRGDLTGARRAPVELEAALGDVRVGGSGDVEQPGAQLAAELELVEELEAGGAVPRLAREVVGRTGRVRSRTSALSRRLRMTSPRWARSASPFLPVISSARAITLSRPS